MRSLRHSAAIVLAVTLGCVGGSAVNGGRPFTAVPVPARTSPSASSALAAGAAVLPAAGTSAEATPSTPPAASRPSLGTPVGALFTLGNNGVLDHFCTASVVHSPHRNLVITAAHCLHSGAGGDYGSNIVFVPGYHDGVTPYGVWPAQRLTVDPRWIDSGDPNMDVGFLTVAQAGNPTPIEDVTGANTLAFGRGFSLPVTMIGYPDNTDEPLTCSNTSTQEDDHQLRLDCAGFAPGTSGSPWLVDVDPRTQRGTVAGVIGGYQQGGLEDDVSYSCYFDANVAALYDSASRAS